MGGIMGGINKTLSIRVYTMTDKLFKYSIVSQFGIGIRDRVKKLNELTCDV